MVVVTKEDVVPSEIVRHAVAVGLPVVVQQAEDVRPP